MPVFFNQGIDIQHLIMKILKTSFFAALTLMVITDTYIKELVFLFLLIAPTMFGACIILRTLVRDRLFKMLVEGSLKSQEDTERLLYLMLEYLMTEWKLKHNRFLMLMMHYEENNSQVIIEDVGILTSSQILIKMRFLSLKTMYPK